MKRLIAVLAGAVALTGFGSDTNYLHLGTYDAFKRSPMQELPHRLRWHDGYDGPEIVRMEVVTNEVVHIEPNAHMRLVRERALRVIASGRTNDVVLQELGVEVAPTTPAATPQCGCACCAGKLTNAGYDFVHILPDGIIESTHLTNVGVLPAKINGVDVLIPLTK